MKWAGMVMKMAGWYWWLLILVASLPENGVAAETGRALRVAMLDEAPFSYVQGSLREGCDPAFYRELLAPVSSRYRFHAYPINRLMEMFARADADLVITPSASLLPPQHPAFIYLGPVNELREIIITRDRPVNHLEDLAGMRVGQASSVCWGLCQQLRARKVAVIERSFRSVEQGLRLLLADRVDAIVVPEKIYHIALANIDKKSRELVISFRGEPIYLFLAINRHLSSELQQQIQASWRAMGVTGYDRLCEPVIKNDFRY